MERDTDEQRYEHMLVVGGSGHGKTQLLQRLILNDLHCESPPALVIIDSQREMLRKIQRLKLFAPSEPLSERIIIIDPEDVDHSPALNMFDMKPARLKTYSQSINEQIEASIIETFNYVFGALAAELTSRQNTTFAAHAFDSGREHSHAAGVVRGRGDHDRREPVLHITSASSTRRRKPTSRTSSSRSHTRSNVC